MCLITNSNNLLNFKIAEYDIVAYKVLCINTYANYVTPYTRFPIKLNVQYYDYKILEYYKIIETQNTEVYGGIFHLFKYEKDAVNLKNCFNGTNNEIYIVLKAIIPKNSRYIEGVDDENNQVFGTKSVIYKLIE